MCCGAQMGGEGRGQVGVWVGATMGRLTAATQRTTVSR